MSRTHKTSTSIIASLALALALAGCSASNTLPNSSYKLQEGDSISRDDLTNEKPVGWSEYEVLDENTIRASVWLDSDGCNDARAEIVEKPETIEITVFQGDIPKNKRQGAACLLIAKHVNLVMATEDPIGDRKIVRGK